MALPVTCIYFVNVKTFFLILVFVVWLQIVLSWTFVVDAVLVSAEYKSFAVF